MFFKLSDRTRPKYEDAETGPFHPDGHSAMKGYYEVTHEVRADPDEFLAWAGEAIAEFKGKRR